MSKSKKVWIPAILMAIIAASLVAYYLLASHGGGESHPPRGKFPAEGMRRPPGEGDKGYGDYFTTLGTIAVFLGVASFSWFWFKKKLKSPSMLVRIAGRLLFSMHKLMGWAAVILIAVHGGYFLITKLHDDKIYTGIAGFVILLTLAVYGYFLNRVRNKWMRTVHRTLGLIWAPVLLLHAGGSAVMAVIAAIAVGGAVVVLEKMAGRAGEPVRES